MVSKVSYRPFDETDFDELAAIMQLHWHARSANDAYNYLEACDDLAYCLSTSTFSQVARIDDTPCGIVLARAGAVDGSWERRWLDASSDFMEQMRAIDPEAQRRYRDFIEASVRVNEDMIGLAGINTDSEITLLAVASTAQHLGIGSVLLDAASSYVASCGFTETYLCTDTDCTWKFYEQRGLKRIATHRATREERHLLPREMYLYSLDLSS